MIARILSMIKLVHLFITVAESSDARQTFPHPPGRLKRGGFFKPAVKTWVVRGGSGISEDDGTPEKRNSRTSDSQATQTREENDTNKVYVDDENVRETPIIPQDVKTLISSPAPQTSSANTNAIYSLSICSIQGKRQYMEDEYFTNQNGSFCSVMDGHGGSAVSRYLRQNLYARYLQAKTTALPCEDSNDSDFDEDSDYDNEKAGGEVLHLDEFQEASTTIANAKSMLNDKLSKPGDSTSVSPSKGPKSLNDSSLESMTLQATMHANALQSAFEKIDADVQRISHWSFQGSTAVAVKLYKAPSSQDTVLISANVGDSRAVLSRAGVAINLTRDHKPNDPIERARVENLGGRVDWFGPVDAEGKPLTKRLKNGCYRINRNLALSRAIGDRSELPFVSSKVDIEQIMLEPKDEFVVLASDGLWDVFERSQDVVSFCSDKINQAKSKKVGKDIDISPDPVERVRRKMSKLLVREALRRGSMDNITVVIIWLPRKENLQ